MSRFYLILTAFFGALAVALGAFGAHALNAIFSTYQQEIWQKAVLYQMFHTAILGLVSLLALHSPSRILLYSARFFSIGIVLFSGSLYLLALSGISKLGMVTPLGGVAFLLGWVALGIYAWNLQTLK